MQSTENTSAKIAEYLLDIRAINLKPDEPYTWTSGWKSPIYSDNRLSLSFPHVRQYIKEQLGELIKYRFPSAEAVVGVATAGIAPGVLAADYLQLPFGYVRSEAKKHGMGKQIEGDIKSGQRVVIVEDLVSTGKSSIQALHSLRDAGCEVLGMVSIFTYGFDAATQAFVEANCPYYSLCDYNQLIATAVSKGIVQADQLEVLSTWRNAPETWGR